MKRHLLPVVFLLVSALPSKAVEWISHGAREAGMGGAGVATVKDANALYWNPAAFGLMQTSWKNHTDAGTHVFSTEENLVSEMVQIFDTIDYLETTISDLQTIQDRLSSGTGTEEDLQAMLQIVLVAFMDLNKYDVGLGLSADATMMFQFGRVGAGYGYYAYGEGAAIVDLFGLALASTGDATTNFQNAFYLSGAGPGDRFAEGSPEDDLAEHLETIMISGGIAPSDAEVFAEELVYQSQQAGADIYDPAVQQVMEDLVSATTGNNPEIVDNQTGVSFEGILLQEISAGYGFPLLDGKIAIGGNLKTLFGTTYQDTIRYGDVDSFDQAMARLTDPANQAESTSWSMDIGILYSPLENLRFGLTGRNVTSPGFRLADGTTYKVAPTFRAGAAYWPFKTLCLAADIDLTSNPTNILFDYKTREYSVGAEFATRFFALRAGVSGNLLAHDDKLDYALGIGIGAGKIFQFDIAVVLDEMSDISKINRIAFDLNDLDNAYLPDGIQVAFSLRFNAEF